MTIQLRPLDEGGKAICPASYKADVGDSGQYESIVSVFGNIDYTGDVVVSGAYADDVAFWKASEDNLPVIWSHQWQDPEYHIGYVLDLKELEPGHADLPEALKPYGGLWTHNQLDMDAPKAKQVFRLLKGRRVKQFSFHYDVLEATYGKVDAEQVRFLKKLHLNETGPTLLGANNLTDLLGTKTLGDGLTPDEVAAVRAILSKNAPAPGGEPVLETHAPTLAADGVIQDLTLRLYDV